jgi:hypothetical protein
LFLVNLCGVRDPKKKSRCPQPKLLAAQSLFLRTAEAFHKMAACLRQEQAANLYSDKQSAVDASRSARNLFQLISLPLRAAKSVSQVSWFPLRDSMVPIGSFLRWLSSTAGYVPGNEAQLSLSDYAHHKRVLSRGCYPFLSGRLENLSVFLASLSASTKGVTSNCKPLCLCSLPEPHDSVRRPFAGLKNRNPRDGSVYT